MLTKLLIALCVLGTLAFTSTPTVAQDVSGQTPADLYVGDTTHNGTAEVMDFRCNFRILNANPPPLINPNFLTCNIPCANWWCRSGVIAPGFRFCINGRHLP